MIMRMALFQYKASAMHGPLPMTLRPKQNGWYLADNILVCIFQFIGNEWTLSDNTVI